ncbi:MAG: four helix bundle protein [Terriglobia bacterium]
MQSARRLEELHFWQRARQLARAIYDFTSDARFRHDRDLCSQLQRAAVSVMSNIAEGFGRGSNEEFVYFLYVAKGSIAEVESQL